MEQVSFLIANPIILRRAIEAVSRLTVLEHGKRWLVMILPEKTRRTLEQNSRMWACLTEISRQVLVDGKRHGKETWHEFFGRKYRLIETHWVLGELMYVLRSTTKMSIKEFAEYMTQIEAHATQEFGVRFTETREFFDEWRRYK
jgi:hypothetical protein